MHKKTVPAEADTAEVWIILGLLQSIRLTILVVELRVSLLVAHELLNDGVPLQGTVKLVCDVTDSTYYARAVANLNGNARIAA